MSHTEILHTFNPNREDCRNYGLACELWKPQHMERPDRHNEIEINFFKEGDVTYLFYDRRFKIPPKRIVLFWGLMPHQIIDCSGSEPYYVVTVPLSTFLSWNLHYGFVEDVLSGKIMVDASDDFAEHDSFMFSKWHEEIDGNSPHVLLEIQARLSRMSCFNKVCSNIKGKPKGESRIVEQVAHYIAQNIKHNVTLNEIGRSIGVHPDYANSLFKKAFGCTIYEYLLEERIAAAKRMLITTDNKISDIAYDVGFNSIGRFNAAFKRICSCTPRDFRKNLEP